MGGDVDEREPELKPSLTVVDQNVYHGNVLVLGPDANGKSTKCIHDE